MPDRSRSGRPHTAALAVVAVVAAAGVVIAYLLWVRTAAGQRLDQRAFEGRSASPDAHRAAGALLSTISVGSLAVAIIVLALLALVRHRRTLALVAVVSIGGAVVTTELLKFVVFSRPALLGGASVLEQNSYPSGHTTIAYAVGIAAVIVAPRGLRRFVAAAAFLYGTGVGLGTIVAGWHRPSDVVGGLLVATAWAAGTVVAFVLVDGDAFGRARPGMRSTLGTDADEAAARGYVMVAAVVVTAGWLAAIAIALARRGGGLELPHVGGVFVGACAAIVGFAALVFAALLLALRPALPPGRSHDPASTG